MKIFFYLFLLATFFTGYSQNTIENFTGLSSVGELPVHLTELSIVKAKANLNQNLSSSPEENQARETFYQESNFFLDEMMLSGRICFNDPVSKYVSKIAHLLAISDPELNSKLKLYVSKSHYFNATSTDLGYIYTNVGLIARLSSEAQLAYILGHEIAHIKKKHSMSQYLEEVRMIYSAGRYQRFSRHDKILNSNFMSQEDEYEADEQSYELYYKQSKYSLDEIDSSFQIMLHSEKPFAEIPFNTSKWESEYYILPKAYYGDSLKKIDWERIYKRNESGSSTHPSSFKRKLAIQKLKIKETNTNRQRFVNPEEDFYTVRTLCRLETIKQMVISGEYIDAFYNAWVMSKELPDNKFLDYTMFYCMYIYEYNKTNGSSNYLGEKATDQGYQIQHVTEFFKKITAEELNVLALRYYYQIKQKYGEDSTLFSLRDSLFNDLVFKNKASYRQFFSNSELERDIKLNNPNSSENKLYYLNGFSEFMDNEDFKEDFKKWDQKHADEKRKQEEYDKLTITEKNKVDKKKIEAVEKEKREINAKGKHLGLSPIVIIDPDYYVINESFTGGVDIFKTESSKINFIDKINFCNAKLKANILILSSKNLKQNDIDKIRHISNLTEWFYERIEQESKTTFIPFSTLFIGSTVNYFKTSNFVWMGVVCDQTIRNKSTSFYSLAFNVNDGNRLFNAYSTVKGTDMSGSFVNSRVYNALFQLSTKNK